MILDGWFWTCAVICTLSFLLCVLATIIKTYPDDFSILSLAAVEIFTVIYSIAAAVGHLGGENQINGPQWEFWGYVLTALLLPVLAFFWAVTDKTRWSNLVMGAVGPTILVMIHRMQVIWHV